jgi:hypothetical protein
MRCSWKGLTVHTGCLSPYSAKDRREMLVEIGEVVSDTE